MKHIGIDIGTTTISAVVLENDTLIHSVTKAHGAFLNMDADWARVQNAELLLNTANSILDALLADYPDTEAIGLTGQMHGIVYLDEVGTPVSPLYTWQDGRAGVPENGETLVQKVEKLCGITVPSGYGLMSHLYEQAHGNVPPRARSLATIMDALAMQLTGRTHPLTHVSNAASLGFFDNRALCFREDLLTRMDMDPALLPDVTATLDIVGYYHNIPVTVALGDNQAAYLGSAGTQVGTVLVNMGTGGQISVFSDTYYEAPGIEPRPILPGRYLLSGSSLCGGRAYAIVERFLREVVLATGTKCDSMYGVMAALAEQGAAQSDRMRVSTLFNGTRTDPDVRGSVTGLTENNFTPAGLVYGCLEGMADELYGMYAGIRSACELKTIRLVGSGNGIRKNPMLQKIFSEKFSAPLTLAAYTEEAAAGAARTAQTVEAV